MSEPAQPDADTSRVCWVVVVAALNDLAASASDVVGYDALEPAA